MILLRAAAAAMDLLLTAAREVERHWWMLRLLVVIALFPAGMRAESIVFESDMNLTRVTLPPTANDSNRPVIRKNNITRVTDSFSAGLISESNVFESDINLTRVTLPPTVNDSNRPVIRKNNITRVTDSLSAGLIFGPPGDDDLLTTFTVVKRNKTLDNITMEELKGKTLRVVAMIEPPYVNYLNLTPEAEESMGYPPGIIMQILKQFGEELDVSFEFFTPTDNVWGEQLANGSWTGAIGHLNRGVDLANLGAMIIRYDRHSVMEFTFPFMASDTGMMIRSPDKYTDNTFLIVSRPFSWEIFYSVFVQQGLPIQPKSWTCRTLLAIWWLAALTLVATFTGNMVALFAVDKNELPWSTKEQLVYQIESKGYSVILEGKSATRKRFIEQSQRDVFKRLWYQMDTLGKATYVDSLEEGTRIVENLPRKVLLGAKESLEVLASTNCNVTVLNGGLLPVWFSIPLAKGSPYVHIMSDRIQNLVEMGFIVKWMKDYSFYLASRQGKTCRFETGISTRGKAIDPDRAQGAFWLLIGGVCIAAALLSYEYVRKAIIWLLKKSGHKDHPFVLDYEAKLNNNNHPPFINGWVGNGTASNGGVSVAGDGPDGVRLAGDGFGTDYGRPTTDLYKEEGGLSRPFGVPNGSLHRRSKAPDKDE